MFTGLLSCRHRPTSPSFVRALHTVRASTLNKEITLAILQNVRSHTLAGRFFAASLSLFTSSTMRRGSQPYASGRGKRDSHPHLAPAVGCSSVYIMLQTSTKPSPVAEPSTAPAQHRAIQISRSCGLDWWSCAGLHGGSGKWVLSYTAAASLSSAACRISYMQWTNEHGGNAPHQTLLCATTRIEAQYRIHPRARSRVLRGREKHSYGCGGRHWMTSGQQC